MLDFCEVRGRIFMVFRFVVEEIMNFCQDDLISEDIILLDASHTIYVWIGEQASKDDKRRAFDFANEYIRTGRKTFEIKLSGNRTRINLRMVCCSSRSIRKRR